MDRAGNGPTDQPEVAKNKTKRRGLNAGLLRSTMTECGCHQNCNRYWGKGYPRERVDAINGYLPESGDGVRWTITNDCAPARVTCQSSKANGRREWHRDEPVKWDFTGNSP